MSAKRLALPACAALVLAACAIGQPIPQATTYVVDPPPAAAGAPTSRRPETLRMGNVRVAAAYAGNALVYRLDDVQYTSDPYNAFIAEPGAMLGDRMAEWLDRAGPFSAVAQPGSTRPAPYVLEATVAELYGDFRAGRPPAAVLVVQFALIDQAGARPKVVHECTIARRVDLSQASPEALVRGYGKALAEILSQLAPELGAADYAPISPPSNAVSRR
jgi:cholesterol transport system auxiliary component